jgi:hypothetical protein
MNVQILIKGLELGLTAIEQLKAASDPDNDHSTLGDAVKLTGALASIGANVLNRVEEGKTVASSREVSVIQAINRELGLANDALAKAIAAS